MIETKLVRTEISIYLEKCKLVVDKKSELVDACSSRKGQHGILINNEYIVDNRTGANLDSDTFCFMAYDSGFRERYEIIMASKSNNDIPAAYHEFSTTVYAHPSISEEVVNDTISKMICDLQDSEDEIVQEIKRLESKLLLRNSCKQLPKDNFNVNDYVTTKA